MAEQWGFQIASSLASQHLTDAKYVQGSYIVVATIAERDALPIKNDTDDGVIINGSLVYVSGTKESYRYTVTGDTGAWVKEEAGSLLSEGNGIKIDTDNKINIDTTGATEGQVISIDDEGKIVWKNDAITDVTAIETAIGKDAEGNLIAVTDRIKNEAKDATYNEEITGYAWVNGDQTVISTTSTVEIGDIVKLGNTEYAVTSAIDDKITILIDETEVEFTRDSTKDVKNVTTIAEELAVLDANKVVINPETEATATATTIKVGETTYNIEGIAETYTNATPVPAAIGGIEKGETFTNITITELFNKLLYPYIAFTYTVEASDAVGTFEYGTAKTITSITPTITNGTKTINGITIKKGDDVLYSSTSVESGVAITLAEDKKVTLDGTANCTITVTITDGKTSTPQDLKYIFVKSDYYAVSDSDTEIPTEGTKSAGSSGDSITVADNQYIWYFSATKTSANIKQFANNTWSTVDGSKYVGDVTFTLASGVTATYHAFVTAKLITCTNKYKLA